MGTDNSYVDGELEQELPLPAEVLGTDNGKKVYGLYVNGTSMEVAGIPDGSIAVVTVVEWRKPQKGK